MNRNEATQIANLLNTRNQLVLQYDADRILDAAVNYDFIVSQSGDVLACAELKKVQWYQFEICHLTTAPGVEGKGIARELFRRIEGLAITRSGRILQCTIRRDNKRSEEFFTKNGFIRVSEFYNHDSGNIVGVWQKVLSPLPIR